MSKRVLLVSLVALTVAMMFALLPDRDARAATLCVNPGGTGGCYSSIQAALNAAAPGDIIDMAAGQYPPFEVTKPLTVQGAGPSTVVGGIDVAAVGPVTLSDLMVQGGGGWGIRADSSPVMLRNILVAGQFYGIFLYGGGIQASNLSVYSLEGLVCDMNATAVISNSVLTTLTHYNPTNCSAITLVNDTILGAVSYPSRMITTTNTIFGGGCATDPNSTINSLGHNIDIANNCALNATGDMTNTNPLLTPLVTVNGAWINALQPGSPAIDKGADAACPSADITGFARPFGAHCDIGAYEWRPMNFFFRFFPFIAKSLF